MGFAWACALTVLIETPFLALWGYRQPSALAITACVNVITNLTMNLALTLCFRRWTPPLLLTAEALVVVVEYLIYTIPFGRSRRLFLLTLAANELSFGLGLLMANI